MERTVRRCSGWMCLAVIIGCSQSPDSGQFKSYKELAQQEPVTTDAESVTGAGTDSNPNLEGSDTAALNPPDAIPLETPVSALAPVNVVDGTSMAAVLKVFPTAATNAAAAPTETTAAAVSPESRPQGIQLLVPHREFKIEGPQNAIRVSYDDLDLLKVLNMEPVPEDALKHFPSWLKALDGQRVRLRGFMYPTFQATGIDQFVLARDNQICCFGRNPKVYDLVSVQMRDRVTTDYIQNRPFDVVGIFRIDLISEGGKPMGLYWLEDSIVINK